MAIRVVAAVIGGLIVLATGWSVLGTLVVPRRIRSRIPRVVFIVNRNVFHFFTDRVNSYELRDRILAFQAPVQLIGQVFAWLALYELGFGLLMWPFVGNGNLGNAMEQAGSALCTLGFLVPHSNGGVALDPLAALAGLGTVALQIGYLPTLYAAFNRREGLITMLDSRAGVPSWGPELLARTHYGLGSGVSAIGELPGLFEGWEQWSADVSESHTTYVPLIWFRSPRPLSSWVTAQLAILDAAAPYLALRPKESDVIQARLCCEEASPVSATSPALWGPIPFDADPNDGISLSYDDFVAAIERLREVDYPIERSLEDAWADFLGWRVNYEAAAYAVGLHNRPAAGIVVGPTAGRNRTHRPLAAKDGEGDQVAKCEEVQPESLTIVRGQMTTESRCREETGVSVSQARGRPELLCFSLGEDAVEDPFEACGEREIVTVWGAGGVSARLTTGEQGMVALIDNRHHVGAEGVHPLACAQQRRRLRE